MKKIILIVIIVIAAMFRFYQLGSNPPSLYWDEVALGYNAYSIAETLKDEEGRFLPIDYFRSFGDFKPPGYIYAAVPMIKLFGLTEWTTRFPSAFFGTLSVLLTYLITQQFIKRIFTKENNRVNTFITDAVPLIAAFLLAISPWHTQISRVAYEANLALFLNLMGIYLFFKAINSTTVKFKTLFLSISGLFFVSTLYTFNSNRVFTPLLIATIGIIYLKEILNGAAKRSLVPLVTSLLLAILLLLPLTPHLLSKEGQLRFKEVNIFSDSEPVQLANERIERLGNTWWAKIINNRRVFFAQEWLDGYFKHFSGKFLLISGDTNPRFSLQDVGQIYLIELPFLLVGLYVCVIRRKKEDLFVLSWMILAPVPAAFARETPHALRTLNMLPTLQIITAYGVIHTIKYLSKSNLNSIKESNNFKVLVVLLITVSALLFQMYYYLHNYYIHYPKFSAKEWQYGYKHVVQEISKLESNYDRIVMTDGFGRPYINMLFYLKYPPAQFQKERQAKTDDTGFGFIEVTGFNKYQFRGINWKTEVAKTDSQIKTLVVGKPLELKINKFTKGQIKDMSGETIWVLNEVPTGIDAEIELGFRDENGNRTIER